MIYSKVRELLLHNVLDISFITQKSKNRRMLCTKSDMILNSFRGRYTFLYRTPSRGPNHILADFNNVLVWDMIKKNFRNVKCDTVVINNMYPETTFWKDWKNIKNVTYIFQ